MTENGTKDKTRKRRRGCRRVLIGAGLLSAVLVILVVVGNQLADDPETDQTATTSETQSSPASDIPDPAEPPTPAPTSTPTPTVDANSAWQARDYRVLDIVDASFGTRTRHVIHLVAPEAVTREQRLATLMAEALRAYRQREIEDAASLRLWAGEQQEWLLARIIFAADQCGWTGEECGRSYWSDASAGTATFTDEQMRINAYESATRDRFLEPILALNEEGQPMSEAGWGCYEPIAIPDGGGCYNDGGLLWEDANETTCRQLEMSWLRVGEEWGGLDDYCAVDRQNRYVAVQLDVDLAIVEGNHIAMSEISYSDEHQRIDMPIPRSVERRQDLTRIAAHLRPTATPAPCEADAVVQYMGDVRQSMDGLGAALFEAGQLFTSAGTNPLLLIDQDWLDLLAVQMVVMQLHLDALAAMTAPPFLHTVHELLMSSVATYKQFLAAAAKGVDELDDAELLRAMGLANEATAALDLSNAEWQRLCG